MTLSRAAAPFDLCSDMRSCNHETAYCISQLSLGMRPKRAEKNLPSISLVFDINVSLHLTLENLIILPIENSLSISLAWLSFAHLIVVIFIIF